MSHVIRIVCAVMVQLVVSAQSDRPTSYVMPCLFLWYQFRLSYYKEKWCSLSLAPAVQESMCHAQLVDICLGAWLAAPTNSLLDTTDSCAPLSTPVAVLYVLCPSARQDQGEQGENQAQQTAAMACGERSRGDMEVARKGQAHVTSSLAIIYNEMCSVS